ncbi:hypothetical protein CA51_38130 [Rosistilla oblonga]|nr:hypothetical protein CA51_38130 [Rosistilla oblonga]
MRFEQAMKSVAVAFAGAATKLRQPMRRCAILIENAGQAETLPLAGPILWASRGETKANCGRIRMIGPSKSLPIAAELPLAIERNARASASLI